MYKHFDSFDSDYSNNSVRYLCTPSEFTKNNFLYVQECGELYTKAEKSTKRKGLNSYLIACVLEGSGTLSYEGKKHSLSKNDIFFIDCMKYHLYGTNSKHPWSVAWVHFNGGTAKAYYDTFRESNENIVHFENSFELYRIINEINKTARKKSADSELIHNEQLCRLLTFIITESGQKKQHSLDDIVSYINARFTEKITLDDISAKFYISKYHLSRSLKNYLGVNFSEYITGKRIDYAKQLLRFSDNSIEDIAYMTGTGTPSHFIYAFKKIEGITPLSYRNKWTG